MCSKVLNGHIILTDTSITTILAPEMTYTPENQNSRQGLEGNAERFLPKIHLFAVKEPDDRL